MKPQERKNIVFGKLVWKRLKKKIFLGPVTSILTLLQLS